VATANDLITAAYRRARIIGQDQTLTAGESADALASLNRMLDSWWNDKLLVYQVVQENFALSIGNNSRTIGTGGNFSTTRPVKIVDGCFVRIGDEDYPVAVIEDRVLYDRIPNKSQSGRPTALWYDPAYPLGTIYFNRAPDAADSLYIRSWKRLQTLASLVTAIALPPGYEDLIVDGLGIKDAPGYGLTAPADVIRSFGKSRRDLGTVNQESLVMELDTNLFRASAGYDIRSE
jgi:hypothetical protein